MNFFSLYSEVKISIYWQLSPVANRGYIFLEEGHRLHASSSKLKLRTDLFWVTKRSPKCTQALKKSQFNATARAVNNIACVHLGGQTVKSVR